MCVCACVCVFIHVCVCVNGPVLDELRKDWEGLGVLSKSV